LADVYGMLLCTWVVIGSRLTTADHVAAVCRAKYYQLRQLKPMTHLKVFLRKSLSKENFQMWHTHLRKFLLAKVNFQK